MNFLRLPLTVVVYGKPECSLCDKARAVVEHLQREFGYLIQHVDISRDPVLFARYREAIPVVVLNGREIARGRVTIPGMRAALTAVRK